MRRIGVLGGTFDPIHNGHLEAGRAAEAALNLTEIIVVTASTPPHRAPVASVFHRFAMVALAVADRPHWSASELELDLGARSYTTETLGRFHALGYDRSELFFVIGADAFREIESWMDYPAILDRAHFAIISRPGFPAGQLPRLLPRLAQRFALPDQVSAAAEPALFLIDTSTTDVSSTAIRQKRSAGQPIADLVPPLVAQHIERHALYLENAETGCPPGTGRATAAGGLHGRH